ncbi:hypothetical protein ACFQRB_17165 [Halobaculum litoreum]|uniref:Uncharacterized protein n=2 Tax=Halobaculum litoreum TaxID=3031998 RepID=A0ABD5XW69_9EURY
MLDDAGVDPTDERVDRGLEAIRAAAVDREEPLSEAAARDVVLGAVDG